MCGRHRAQLQPPRMTRLRPTAMSLTCRTAGSTCPSCGCGCWRPRCEGSKHAEHLLQLCVGEALQVVEDVCEVAAVATQQAHVARRERCQCLQQCQHTHTNQVHVTVRAGAHLPLACFRRCKQTVNRELWHPGWSEATRQQLRHRGREMHACGSCCLLCCRLNHHAPARPRPAAPPHPSPGDHAGHAAPAASPVGPQTQQTRTHTTQPLLL